MQSTYKQISFSIQQLAPLVLETVIDLLIFKVFMKSNIKNVTMFIQVVFSPKYDENVEIPHC